MDENGTDSQQAVVGNGNLPDLVDSADVALLRTAVQASNGIVNNAPSLASGTSPGPVDTG